MNFKKRLMRCFCLLLAVLQLFVLIPCMSVSAINTEFSIAKGEYIRWGSLSGDPIVWVALTNSEDSTTGGNIVDVMTKEIVAMKPLNDSDNIPQALSDTSLYKWLNSTSGFWSEQNFSGNDRYLRAIDSFTIMNASDLIGYFSDGRLGDAATAKYNGSKKPWWLWGGNASQKMGYQVSDDGVLEEFYFSNVSSDKAGVRPVATLNLESFYISSGKGTSSSPYVISSVYDSDLKSLNVSGCVISPAFSENKLEYTSTVTSNVEKIVVSAAAKDKNAEVSYYLNERLINTSNGSGATINLNYGANKIDVRVLAVDGFSETVYSINVTRQQESNTVLVNGMQLYDNEPSFSLQPEELKLSPQFSKDCFSYSIDTGHSVKKCKIVVESLPDATITLKLNNENETSLTKEGTAGATAKYSSTFDVTSDLALLTLNVTEAGNTKKYVINVSHGEAPKYVNENAGAADPEESSPDEDPDGNANQEDLEDINLDNSGLSNTLPFYEKHDGLQWWAILLIIIGGIALIAGLVFIILHIKNRKNEDDLLDDQPYYMGSSSPLKQDLQREKQHAKEVNDFREVVPKNSQYRGVYDNRPNAGSKSNPLNANEMFFNHNSGTGFGNTQNQPPANRFERKTVIGERNDPFAQRAAERSSAAGFAAENHVGKTAERAGWNPTTSAQQDTNKANEQFKLDFDADKEYHFDEFTGSADTSGEISSDSGAVLNTGIDPVETLKDKMKFDTDKDIFSSTAKPEDELNGFMK